MVATNKPQADPEYIAELEREVGMEVSPQLTGSGDGPNVVSLRSAVNPAVDERIEAFSINGTMYSILTRPKVNAGLRYIHLARTRGSEIAIAFMLETLLGVEGWEALMAFDDLTEEDLEAVVDAASKIMAGAVEAPKDKQRKGSRRSAG